ncbi:MAG: diguanylate cyclase/phosphodiesterase [Acidimicrobiales bacterium]|nr:diguanylate cyclase/phosphodiesterase [Acidimicrobiales bacterium]
MEAGSSKSRRPILLAVDDPGLREDIRAALELEGLAASATGSAHEALARASAADIAIIDRRLRGISGIEMIRELRRRRLDVHIIMVAAVADEEDRMTGFLAGADDYVLTSSTQRELTARVAAASRRRAGGAVADAVLAFGTLEVDLAARQVRVAGRDVSMPRQEFQLLVQLARHPRRTFTRDELLHAAWSSSVEWQTDATVTEHIRRLRLRLEPDPAHPTMIQTVRGVGYRFEPPTETAPPVGLHARSHAPASREAIAVIVGSTIVFASAPTLSLLGVAATHDLVGHDLMEFVALQSVGATRARHKRARSGRWPRPELITLRRSDGEDVIVELASTPVLWDGEPASQVTMWPLISGDRPIDQIEGGQAAPAKAVDGDLAREIERGLERGEFVLHYQPVVRLDDARPVGVEALLRWRHPRRGLLPPDAFIEAAEQSGTIVSLGRHALEEACRQAQRWRADGLDLDVSVNISPRQLIDGCLIGDVERLIGETAMPAGRLWLEVTETSLVQDLDEVVRTLTSLNDIGAQIAIDDFGTGWASLTYLHRFPVRALKIDRSFVDALNSGTRGAHIVASLISLAAELEITVVAEGIELEEQRTHLQRLGCGLGQGYLFSHPRPPAELAWGRPGHVDPT